MPNSCSRGSILAQSSVCEARQHWSVVKDDEAAAHGRLVSDAELPSLRARIHVGRSGQLASYGDDVDGRSETKQALEEDIRKRAYPMWEQDGCPEGRADDYWQQALHQHLRERAYVLWQQEGSPEGRADENWNRLGEFGAQ